MRKIKTRKTHNYWKIWISLLMIVTLLCQCKASTDTNEGKDPIEIFTPLLVFYEDGTKNVLDNFKLEHPEIPLDIYRFGGNEEDLIMLTKQKGDPDLLLLNLSMSKSQDRLIEEKYAASLDDFYANDAEIDQSAYFPGTFEVGRSGDSLRSLPLGISVRTLTLREEYWKDSAFEKLESGYTAQDLFDAMEQEINRQKETSVFFSLDGMAGGNLYHVLQMIGALQQTEDGIQIDEALFAKLYALQYRQSQINDAALQYWENIGYENPQEVHYRSGLDPRNYQGNFVVSVWPESCGAPQLCLSYAASVNQHFWEQKTYALYYPTIADGNAFGASVEIEGLVGIHSDQQRQAYDALRLMMDTPISLFTQPGGLFENTFCPVNKENAHALLNRFENQPEYSDAGQDNLTVKDGTGTVLFTVEKTALDDDEKQKLQNVLENISFLYRYTEEEGNAIAILNRYQRDHQIEDYRACYAEIMELLKSKKK